MITTTDIKDILKEYNKKDLTIAVLGGHSALDVCHGAKKLGFKTLAVCQKGREKTYAQYYKTREAKGCIDDIILVDRFSDLLLEKHQKELRRRNAIFIHNRYFWVYFDDFSRVENDFRVPIFGTRQMVRMEERDAKPNQYDLLEKARIRIPKIIRKAGERISDKELKKKMDAFHSPMLVKAAEEDRGYERDFFIVTKFDDYSIERAKRRNLVEKAAIEEFVVGPNINFNYFYSPLTGSLEIMGADTRRQTNIDGFLRLPYWQQQGLHNRGFEPTMIENGHIAVTVKESILEKAFELGEKFVKASQKECSPGIIGPFALQGAYVSEKGKEDFVVFDVSMRIPGSPGTRFTPYSGYLYGESISYGERIAMEIQEAVQRGKLKELLT